MTLPFLSSRSTRGGSFAAGPAAPVAASGYALDGSYSVAVAPIMHFDASILDGADAANNPLNGSAVSAWGDRSGNATSMDSVQGTVSKKPTFNTGSGDPYVSFDGGDYMEIANGPTVDTQTEGLTIITLANRVQGTIWDHIVGIANSTGGTPIFMREWGVGVIIHFGGSTDNSFTTAEQTVPTLNFDDVNMFTFTKSTGGTETTNCKWYYDGGTSSVDNSGMYDPVNGGARPDTLTMPLDRIGLAYATIGLIYARQSLYETMAFDYEMGTDDLNTVKDYLAAKWSTPIAAGSNVLGAFS